MSSIIYHLKRDLAMARRLSRDLDRPWQRRAFILVTTALVYLFLAWAVVSLTWLRLRLSWTVWSVRAQIRAVCLQARILTWIRRSSHTLMP